LKCEDCGIVYLEPKKENLANFYAEDYRKLYTPVIGKALNSREIFEMYLPYQHSRIDKIRDRLSPNMKALDIGCSAGHFLYVLKEYVRECIGIEFNKENAEFVNKELGIKTYTEPIEKTDLPLGYFDLITAFQVLEHVEDPIQFLTTLRKYLKPDGYLYLEVPNINDALISIYNIESYCDFSYREPHIFYYSPKTLSMVLERSGFLGDFSTIQRYNFTNQMNWILADKPQKSADIGMSKPILVASDLVDKRIKTEFNQWIQTIDKEYKQLLNKHDLGETIIFIGKKIG
jgi:2-polyprenyl-3-methyl-5-hydroxy-6-metoxy-1,4-benzoquinol methylase